MSAQKWALLLLVTTLVLTSACTVASAATTQGGVVQIISPSKNSNAGPTQPVSGKAQLSKGYTLWIVPYDPTVGKYYPKAPLTVRSDATWSSRLSVATIFGVGKVFQIQAVVANPSASGALKNYAAQGTGISKLPQGAQAVDAITVTRVAADVSGKPSATPSTTYVTSTTTASASSATAAPSSSTTTVAEVSAGATSSNPLPGFEALSALCALAAIFVAARCMRHR